MSSLTAEGRGISVGRGVLRLYGMTALSRWDRRGWQPGQLEDAAVTLDVRDGGGFDQGAARSPRSGHVPLAPALAPSAPACGLSHAVGDLVEELVAQDAIERIHRVVLRPH
jgi:hypothetical protein